MKVLGIYGSIGFDGSARESYIHDAGATLFVNGEHICSIQEERLSRLKYDGRYPEKSIDYVLDNVKKEEIDLVIFVDIGLEGWVKEHLSQGKPHKFLQEVFPNADIGYISHHQAHAYSSIFTQPANEGVCIVIDGGGCHNWTNKVSLGLETGSLVYFNKRKGVFRYIPFNAQWGLLHQTWSHYIYCKKAKKKIEYNDPLHHCAMSGKIMGLAAYGSKKHNTKLYEFGQYFPQCEFSMRDPDPYPLTPEEKAQLLQYNFEESLIELIERFDEDYLEPVVCLTGGVFLNINANTKIVQKFKHRKFHITPFVSDCGLSYGAAAFGSSLWN